VCDARMAVIEESEGEKREESTATSGGSLLSGGRGGVGVGSVPRGGRRRSGEGGGAMPHGPARHGCGGSGPLGKQWAAHAARAWRARCEQGRRRGASDVGVAADMWG
jgi:hypothetical protein